MFLGQPSILIMQAKRSPACLLFSSLFVNYLHRSHSYIQNRCQVGCHVPFLSPGTSFCFLSLFLSSFISFLYCIVAGAIQAVQLGLSNALLLLPVLDCILLQLWFDDEFRRKVMKRVLPNRHPGPPNRGE